MNLDDPRVSSMKSTVEATGAKLTTFSSKTRTATYYRSETEIAEDGKHLLSLKSMITDGEHNYQNALGAIALVRQFEVSAKQILTVLENFPGVEGREQFVRELNGVKIYNDTTATAMESIVVAMQRFGTKYHKKIVMIAGGMDKGLDYIQIAPYWQNDLKALVLLEGTASQKMATAMEHSDVPIHKYFGLFTDAVAKAYSLAVPGDLLILCPGATSFNMFANEFDRGRQFNELVNAL